MGLMNICKALRSDTGYLMPCSAVLDGEYQCRNMSMSVPVKLGKQSIMDIREFKLNAEEQLGLKRTIEVLREQMHVVDKYIKENK